MAGKVTEGISGHGPRFRSLGPVFANNCSALESLKVGMHNLPFLILKVRYPAIKIKFMVSFITGWL